MKKTIILLSSVAVMILIVIVFYFLLYPHLRVLARVQGEKITLADLNRQVWGVDFSGSIYFPKKVSDKVRSDLLDFLIEEKIINQEFERLGLVLEADDVARMGTTVLGEEGFKNLSSRRKSETDLIKENIQTRAKSEKIKETMVLWAEGVALIARFDRYYSAPSENATPEIIKDYELNKNNLSQDKKLAEEYMASIFRELKSGNLTAEEAAIRLNNHPILGPKYFEPYYSVQPSFSFEKSDFIQQPSEIPAWVAEDLKDLKQGVNEPILKHTYGLDDNPYDSHYVLYYIKDIGGGAGSYKDWLEKTKKENVKYSLSSWGLYSAYANSGHTPSCSNTDHWGKKNLSATLYNASLILYTQYYTEAGAGPYPFNVSVTISGPKNGVKSPDLVWSKSGTFETGEAWGWDGLMYGGGSCNNEGYLPIGQGYHYTTEKSDFGNGWELTCGTGYNPYTITASNPTASGYWTTNPLSVNVINGSNVTRTMTWRGSITSSYTISTSVNPAGSGTVSPASATVNAGTAASFNLNSNTGYVLSSVTDNCSSAGTKAGSLSGNIYTVTPARNCTMTANLSISSYTVSTSANPAIGGSLNPTSRTVMAGNSTSFTVSASSGYALSSVTDNCGVGSTKVGALSGSTYTLTPARNCTVTANFSISSYTVSTTVNPPGGGLFNPLSMTVSSGQAALFTFAPATGYTLVTVTDNCSGDGSRIGTLALGNPSIYNISPITRNCVVTATLTEIPSNCQLELEPTTSFEGETIRMLDGGAARGEEALDWYIDWGDQTTNSTHYVGVYQEVWHLSHRYANAGNYKAKLIASSCSAEVSVLVKPETVEHSGEISP